MNEKKHVKGVVCNVNKQRVATLINNGYTVFDIEEGEVNIGDVVLGDLHAHGSREIFNVTRDHELCVYIEATHVTHESIQYLLHHL